jgi:rhodanese-related sulfurtransferase
LNVGPVVPVGPFLAVRQRPGHIGRLIDDVRHLRYVRFGGLFDHSSSLCNTKANGFGDLVIKNISVDEAHQAQQSGSVYLDVRSVPEFDQAHPAGAYNVPLLHLDERTGQMRPNAEFVDVMKANFAPDVPLLVACQAGVRSVQACELLAAAGFTNLANVRGGFGGSRFGEPGWLHAELPVETSATSGRDYATLRRADSRQADA